MFKLKKAARKNAKIKMAITGASGSGKTYSSLLLAKGLVGDWAKIAVLDTENGSASLYSDLGEYQVIDFPDNFTPDNYIKAINFVATNHPEIECLIIDSLSHMWSGKGGELDLHANLGGKFNDWSKITPQHRKVIHAITTSPLHIICCMRAKTDWSLDKDDRGKAKIEKVGLKADMKEGFEYELTISFRLDQYNNAFADKDRTGLFYGEMPFRISTETGETIRTWSESGFGDNNLIIRKIRDLFPGQNESQRELALKIGFKSKENYTKEQIDKFLNDIDSSFDGQAMLTPKDIPFDDLGPQKGGGTLTTDRF